MLGELFRKEDALDTLRFLARSGAGVADSPDEVPPPISRSAPRYSRTSVRCRSARGGIEERVGSSFLRMAFDEEDSEEEGMHTRSASTSNHARRASRICPALSIEVNEHTTKRNHHPYSGSYQAFESSLGSSSVSSPRVTAISSSRGLFSEHGLSYANTTHGQDATPSRQDFAFVAASKMRSESVLLEDQVSPIRSNLSCLYTSESELTWMINTGL